MAVVWIERRDGMKTVTRVDYEADTVEVLSASPKASIKRGVRSISNGVAGGPKVLADAKALDARLGVSDLIEYCPTGKGGYEAVYKSVGDFDRWMRKHKRVNRHAGCGTPCPGDFKGQIPGEFD